jgi:hypothetical protein
MPDYNFTAANCPAAQVPNATVIDPATGIPLVSTPAPLGGSGATLRDILNSWPVRIDLLSRFGGGGRAVLSGLELSDGGGLVATVGAGQAGIDGIVTLAASANKALVDDTRNHIWISSSRTLTVVTGSLLPPAGSQCYLGSVVTADGAVTSIDYSGRMTLVGGLLERQTADAGVPGDTPPAGVRCLTKTAGGIYLWDGASYWQVSPATGAVQPHDADLDRLAAVDTSAITNGQILIGKTSDHSLNLGSIAGTSNQVTVTPGAGTITISLPQDIHTAATPQFAGMGIGGVPTSPLHVLTAPPADATKAAALVGAALVGGSAAGTMGGYNAPAGFTGNFLWGQINGGAALFSVNSAGSATFGGPNPGYGYKVHVVGNGIYIVNNWGAATDYSRILIGRPDSTSSFMVFARTGASYGTTRFGGTENNTAAIYLNDGGASEPTAFYIGTTADTPIVLASHDIPMVRVAGTGVTVGANAAPVDYLSIGIAPIASATRALVNLSNTALVGGSTAGTYMGANPAASTADWIDFQIAGAIKFQVSYSGTTYVAGNLGIGMVPVYKLDLSTSAVGIVSKLLSTGASGTSGGALQVLACNDGAAMGSGERLGGVLGAGAKDGAGSFVNAAGVTFFAAEAWGAAAAGSYIAFETTPKGSTTRAYVGYFTADGFFGINCFPTVHFDLVGVHVSGVGIARFKGAAQYGFMCLDTTTTGGSGGFLLLIGGVKKGQFGYSDALTRVEIYNAIWDASNPAVLITDAGVVAVQTALQVSSKVALTAGGLQRTFAEATATLSGANTTIQVNVPAGVRILGAQIRVDTLVTSGDGGTSWAATYSGGATQAIGGAGQAFTQNTKVSAAFNDTTESDVPGSEVDILIDCDGAHTFSGGVVRAVVYYETFAAMGNAA